MRNTVRKDWIDRKPSHSIVISSNMFKKDKNHE